MIYLTFVFSAAYNIMNTDDTRVYTQVVPKTLKKNKNKIDKIDNKTMGFDVYFLVFGTPPKKLWCKVFIINV